MYLEYDYGEEALVELRMIQDFLYLIGFKVPKYYIVKLGGDLYLFRWN